MSIERLYGKYTPTCDVCGEDLPPENDFYDAVEARKEAGWRSKKTADGWNDICPECQE